MKNRELKRFSRKELLEILVLQKKEIEELQKQLKAANKQLAKRELVISNAGSMAEAALKLNHVFRDVDAAARQYLESIELMVKREQEILNRICEKEKEFQTSVSQTKYTGQIRRKNEVSLLHGRRPAMKSQP